MAMTDTCMRDLMAKMYSNNPSKTYDQCTNAQKDLITKGTANSALLTAIYRGTWVPATTTLSPDTALVFGGAKVTTPTLQVVLASVQKQAASPIQWTGLTSAQQNWINAQHATEIAWAQAATMNANQLYAMSGFPA